MTDAFFRQRGDRFEPTALTRGPWDERAQHGGPPSALLARAAEQAGAELGLPHLARLTDELLKPVPLAPLALALELETRGRSVARLALRLDDGERLLARASALVARVAPIEASVAATPLDAPRPEACPPLDFPFFLWEVGYHTAIELRIARGEYGAGPTFVWMRPRVPLVEGEPTSGPQRALLCADSGNGVSPILDWRRFSFVNPDLTVALHRAPRGEWIGLDARTDVDPALGIGVARTRICDVEGASGHGLQTLLCAPR